MTPELSIVIPCYNARATIVETARSALYQQGVAIEVILVDDGSTDGSVDVLKYAGILDRVRYLRQDNQGVSVARNAGMTVATGRFICFLDSDDVLEPIFGRQMIDLMANRGCRVGYCNYRYFADGAPQVSINIRYPTFEGDVRGRILSEHFIPTPGAVVIQRGALGDLRFDARRSAAADWWFWIQLLLRESICFNPATLINIRVLAHSMGRQKTKMAVDVAAVLEDADKLLAADERITRPDRARFLYRRASALLEIHERRRALACWARAGRYGLDFRRHVNLLAKVSLDAVGARRLAERWLWERRTSERASAISE